jgi:rhamnosyltransferase subunit B
VHILVATLGSAGDMYPFLRLARDLQARGHRVTVVGPAVHASMAQAAGVAFLGMGTEAEYVALLEHPDVWHERRGFGVIWRSLERNLGLLADVVANQPAGEPVALLAHPLALPSAALARAARPDLRVVAAWLAPANLRSLHDPLTIGALRIPRWLPLAWRAALWRLVDRDLIDAVALPGLNGVRAARGLAPVAHFIDHLHTTADASVTLFPPWFAPTPADWPRPLHEGTFTVYDPHPAVLAPELAAFLDAGDAPIAFTPGSGNRQAARWFERALAAANRLGRRAVFLTTHREQVPAALPAHVLWQAYVPLRALLPRCAALVHHGGIGTTSEALRAGVPQLIVPLAYDQFDNAARIEILGCGRGLAGWRARPRALAAALAALTGSPATAAACAAAARRVAADAGIDVAALVERQFAGR